MRDTNPYPIEILDCTLRDGGRLIDCAFRDSQISGIVRRLNSARIDIIELGFLREKVTWSGNSTFFRRIEQTESLLPEGATQKYTFFIDYGYYRMKDLPMASEKIDCGIRYGFTKKDFLENHEALKEEMLEIKKKGYPLYFQCVNTVGYSVSELLGLIALANEIQPVSFGIVDTYGSMYQDDLDRIFSLVDSELNRHIAIDFHGHNNMQMAFALAQRCVKLCQGRRRLILDATLEGMGKCAGNLCTELVAHYLNQKWGKNYEFDQLLDAADEFVGVFKQEYPWGYSLPAFMAGIYQAHPNNVIYLTNKFRLSSKDIRKILSLIEEPKRQRYDYDNIQKIYKNYFSMPYDDSESLEWLRRQILGRPVLIIAAGNTVITHKKNIDEYIRRENPVTISVNFIFSTKGYAFFGNDRRYQKLLEVPEGTDILLTSNVEMRTGREFVFNYTRCIAESGRYFDNSALMLLNLLSCAGAEEIGIAGMDGFSMETANYFNDSDIEPRCGEQFEVVNQELEEHVRRFARNNSGGIHIRFITPSRFEEAM